MKTYEVVDLQGDSYLNPVGAAYGDGSGTHQRSAGSITKIAVHHDATPRPHDYDSVARYRQEAKEHYDRLGPGLQYHYKIDNVGTIFKIRPHTTWLYAVGSAANVNTINICLDGYFHPDVNQVPTREQYEALAQLAIDLCENHPEFPAVYSDVWPHRDFSSTACCGDTLVPYVHQINDKATALNIPSNAVYDWPELQPAAPAAPAPTPAPTPPNIVPSVDTAFKPARYVAQVKTHLDDIVTGQRVADYAPGTEFDFTRRLVLNGNSFLQTDYSAQKTPNRALPEKDFLLKNPSTTPTPPSDPATLPTPKPPVTPPTPSPADQTHEIQQRLTALEAIVAKIVDFLSSIFSGFKK